MSGDVEVRMPRLGDTVLDGVIVGWLVAPGDRIDEGDLLVTIETDKVTTEYPSEVAGTIVDLLVSEGDTVEVGTPIATVARDRPGAGDEGSSGDERQSDDRPSNRRPHDRPQDGGDVEAPPLAASSPMRRSIAEAVTRSWSSAAHAVVCAEAEVGALLAFRDRQRARFRSDHDGDLTLLPLLVRTFALALGRDPDVGVAVAVDDGLVVPVVRAANRAWEPVAADVVALVARARRGELAPHDVSGGDATVTNVGVFGAGWCQPIINRGQPHIVGLGAVEVRPVARPDGIRWAPTIPISLVYDRLQVDEIEAAGLLGRFVEQLSLVPDTSAATDQPLGGDKDAHEGATG